MTAFAYDVRGNLTTETNALGNSVTYAYDKTDRMVTVTDPLSKVAYVEYDGAGNVVSSTLQTDRTFTYDDAGKLLSSTECTGGKLSKTYTYEYDLMGNRTTVTVKDSKQRLVEQRKYTYNESNQVVTEMIQSGCL